MSGSEQNHLPPSEKRGPRISRLGRRRQSSDLEVTAGDDASQADQAQARDQVPSQSKPDIVSINLFGGPASLVDTRTGDVITPADQAASAGRDVRRRLRSRWRGRGSRQEELSLAPADGVVFSEGQLHADFKPEERPGK